MSDFASHYAVLPYTRNRRRTSLLPRLSRTLYPLRRGISEGVSEAVGEFVKGFPCNLLGHRWVEIPSSFVSKRAREGHRMRFRCSRTGCGMMAGFSNR